MDMNCCRTCLSTSNSLYPIFQHQDKNEIYTIFLQITTGLEIQLNDNLPQVMCSKCISTVNQFISFRKRCYTSHTILIKNNNNRKSAENGLNETKNIDSNHIDNSSSDDNDSDINCDDDNVNNDDDDEDDEALVEIRLKLDADLKRNDGNTDTALKAKYDDDFDAVEKTILDNETIESTIKSELVIETEKPKDDNNEPIFKKNKMTVKQMSVEDYLKTKSFIEFKNVKKTKKKVKLKYAEDDSDSKESVKEEVGHEKVKNEVTNDKVKKEVVKSNGPFECPLCHKVLKTKTSLYSHQKIHFGRKLVCEHCGKKFLTNRRLLMHCKSKHGYEKTDKCSYCDYRGSNPELVKIHERIHTGERPYQCACGASFHRRSTYIQHVPSHLTTKTVPCPECPALFKSVTFMKIHQTRHKRRRQKNNMTFN